MARFTLPRDIYHGKGCLETLKTLEGKRAMICVGGGSMKRNGFLSTELWNTSRKQAWRFSFMKASSLTPQLKLL